MLMAFPTYFCQPRATLTTTKKQTMANMPPHLKILPHMIDGTLNQPQQLQVLVLLHLCFLLSTCGLQGDLAPPSKGADWPKCDLNQSRTMMKRLKLDGSAPRAWSAVLATAWARTRETLTTRSSRAGRQGATHRGDEH